MLINVNSWHFNIYEHDQFRAQLCLALKRFYTLGSGLLAASSTWHSKKNNLVIWNDVPIKETQGRNEQNVIRVPVSLFFSAIVLAK